jgi:hypothetical protein
MSWYLSFISLVEDMELMPLLYLVVRAHMASHHTYGVDLGVEHHEYLMLCLRIPHKGTGAT